MLDAPYYSTPAIIDLPFYNPSFFNRFTLICGAGLFSLLIGYNRSLYLTSGQCKYAEYTWKFELLNANV
jgi:hypothetical protein